jgi:hypothetical protein
MVSLVEDMEREGRKIDLGQAEEAKFRTSSTIPAGEGAGMERNYPFPLVGCLADIFQVIFFWVVFYPSSYRFQPKPPFFSTFRESPNF